MNEENKNYIDSIEEEFNKAFPEGIREPDELRDGPSDPAPEDTGDETPDDKVTPDNKDADKDDNPNDPVSKLLNEDGDKPPEDDVDEDAAKSKEVEELAKGLSEKASEKFKKIHDRAWEAEKKAKLVPQLQAELDKLKQQSGGEDVEKLRQQLKELDEIVQKTSLLDHPSFKEKYETPISKQVKIARQIVGASNADKVEAILKEQNPVQRAEKLESIADKLSSFRANQLATVAANIEQIEFERTEAVENWKETKKQYLEEQAQNAGQMTKDLSVKLESAVNEVLSLASGNTGLEVFREVEGEEDWNKNVTNRKAAVRALATKKLTPKDVAEMAVNSVAAPAFRDLFKQAYKELGVLKKEIKKLKGSKPSPASGGAGSQSGQSDKDLSFVDAVELEGRRAGLLR